ncbi:MAG: tRNA pseudouridine(13) synthase TruD [Planctomycetota bacterium]
MLEGESSTRQRIGGPYLTADLPGIGGRLRDNLEDFAVEEELVRAPRGRGRYAWALIEKRDVSTPDLGRRLGAALRCPAGAFGFAGYKDTRAVARQWVSLPWRDRDKLSVARIGGVSLVELRRDDERMSSRLLAANRFRIVVRGLEDTAGARDRAASILRVLERRGVPNFFGPQRFGIRGESPEVGRCLLGGRFRQALDLILGHPSEAELDPRARAFREAYGEGDVRRALQQVPGALRLEKRLLLRLADGVPPDRVARQLPADATRFYLSAWQSLAFNRLLARRLQAIDKALPGDLLCGADSEIYRCDDPELESGKVLRWEASPTGPLFGSNGLLAEGEPGYLERETLAGEGIDETVFAARLPVSLLGGRRVLRVPLRGLAIEELASEGALALAFTLARGSFATAVLAEVTKTFAPPL